MTIRPYYQIPEGKNKGEEEQGDNNNIRPTKIYKTYDREPRPIDIGYKFSALCTYVIVSNKELNLLAKLEEIGYTSSVWKFCWDAVMENLEGSIKDYKGLGKIFSDKLLKEEKE